MHSVVSDVTCQRFEKAALPDMRAECVGVMPRLHEFELTHILDGFSNALSGDHYER
jgi:hypothetical protein